MATASGTTTAFELENSNQNAVQREVTAQTNPVDEILQASNLADATAPDGGYGWVVIASSAVLAWWTIGIAYCWGIFQAALIDQGVASVSKLSFVGSLATSCIAAFAVLNSRMAGKIGLRNLALAGISTIGFSEIITGFATKNVDALFVTAGLCLGVGFSFCFTVLSLAPTQYFVRKRGLANGIVFAGGGLGGAVTSIALNALIQKVGPAWAYRALGGMTLITGLPAAWLIKERTPIRSARLVEWRLFRDHRFTLLFLACLVGTFPLSVPPYFLPIYSTSIGLSTSTGAGLVAGYNFSSAMGRIASGFSCDKIGPLNTLFLAFAVAATSMLVIWPVSTTLAPLALFAVVNGAANGGIFATVPTVIGNLFGSARLSTAMGMVVSGWIGGYLLGAPIAGYLLEAFGGQERGFQAYRPAIIYAGSMSLGAAGLVAFVRLRSSLSPRKRL